MPLWLIVALSALTAARLWRALAVDDVGEPLRRVISRRERLAAFVACPWCLPFWLAAAFVMLGVAYGGHAWCQVALAAPAAAYVASRLEAA